MLTKLKSEIENTVRKYCREPLHRDITIQALCRRNFALHPDTSCKAGMFTLEICRSILGEYNHVALRAATAVELIMESSYMFDSVADDEVDSSFGLTAAEELALAITTLSCGVAVAHEAASTIEKNSLALQAVFQIQINSIAACAGQFLDAYLQKGSYASTEESLNMTCLKSGSIGRLAGEFSASIASDDNEIISLFGDFGFNLFTFVQLADDIQDAFPIDSPPLDMVQNKKTLPLVYFNNNVNQGQTTSVNGIIHSGTDEQMLEFRRRFESSGSTGFCAIVAEVYLNRAKSNLADLRKKLKSVKSLERLVGSLEITPQEVPMAS